ncbi:hypothetical protein BJF79_07425 [Actinomadura sp. CNU-125]|uniref:RHS repeat-associated core domain-containing protein n=1 Tax=Actinomadura sp. CNU-125 TaxID=1904961 RepID=UPI000966711A|nr:RHS repeat-associated core domain-containing protein [Actinomadura sp. CNU-125]OLT34389.1 hypothetical protein BJF79_07425 [Actinomadura sp. CNU-125]
MTGVLRLIGRKRSLLALVAMTMSLVLASSLMGDAVAAEWPRLSEDGRDRRPGTQEVKRVDGKPVKAREEKLPGQAGTPIGAKRPEPIWPKAGRATADLTKAKANARSAASWARAGDSPVLLGAPASAANARAATAVPSQVQVQIADRKAAKAIRSDGLLLTLSAKEQGRSRVGIDYSRFASAHGGDWASRLRLVKLPACALTTPAKAECQKRTPLATDNDTDNSLLSTDVELAGAGSTTVLAAEAGSSGPGGDWGATALSASSSWSAGTNTGEFSWQYPMRVPPVPGDLIPPLTIGYNSGAVDGKTAADNSQASWIGDGFSYWPGSISRKYKPCLDDGHQSGDLCWGRDNAILSLNGQSTELLYDSGSQTWRPKNDNGWKIERLTGATNGDDNGEWWRVTSLEGVQYIFGKNRIDDWSSGDTETNSTWTAPVFGDDSGEPCYDSTFKDAHCKQAWRWNLDHVIDPRSNTITYYYAQETNNYTTYLQTEGGTKYVSGGRLTRIDYGQRQGSTHAAPATARVRFTTADRTDLPDDRICDDGETCGLQKVSPTFFDRKRLTKVTTELLTDKAAGTYSPVDVYDFGQTAQNGVLWLHTIDQTGKDGTDAAAPTITLTGQLMPNRVVSTRGGTGINALPGYDRPRLVGVSNGTGSTTTVTYSDPYATPTPAGECVYAPDAMPTPKSNTKRCFPVKWQDLDGDIINDWYHKYVATSIIESDATGGSRSQLTTYQYLGGAAWRYSEDDGLTKDKWRTWSQWRGYSKVRTISGDGQNGEKQSRTETTYARGMDGNYQGKGATPSNVTVTDSKNLLGGIEDRDTFAGMVIETRTFNGSFDDADEIGATVTMPRWHQTAVRTFNDTNSGDDITVRGGWVQPAWSKTRTRQADGTDQYTESYIDYDSLGREIAVDDEGDPATASDDTCSRTVYADTAAAGLVIKSLPIRMLSVAVDCDNQNSHEPNLVAADMISDTKILYDGGQYGDHPTKGNDTRTETTTGVSNGTSTTVLAATKTFDGHGRVLTQTAAGDPATTSDDRTTTSTYTQAPEGWTKSSTVTTPPISINGGTPAGFTTTTEYNPARGTPTKVTDTNQRVAEAVYDGLGRLVKAWLPNNPRSYNPDNPSTTYEYNFPADGNPASVITKTLRTYSPAAYDTSVELMDGLLRPRQTQTEAPGGGRIVADTKYDSRGLQFKSNAPYIMDGDPSGVLTSADDNQVPAQTVSTYDGAGRLLTTTLYSYSTKKWTTQHQYNGEQAITIPPSGAMPSMSITDARGRVVESRQYKTTDLTGPYLATTTSYDGAGRPHEKRDAAGNVWRTTYDVQGRPKNSTDPDKGTATVTYDHFDQVKTTTDARGTILTRSYDTLGRLLQVSNGGTPLTTYTYDTVASAKGLPATATRHIGDDDYVTAVTGYDWLYRTSGSTITIPASQGQLAGTYNTSQIYNFDGSPSSTTYPAIGQAGSGLPEEKVNTVYNADGLPKRSAGISTYVTDTTYNSFGDVTQLSLAAINDKFIWQTFDRDPATQQLTRATIKRQSSSATYDVESTYNYTNTGAITSIVTDTVGKPTDRQCFTYDYAQRLTQAHTTNQNACGTPSTSTIGGPAPYWTSYEYDSEGEKTGNRTKEIQHAFAGGPATDTVRTYDYPAALGDSGVTSPHGLQSVTETQGANTRTDLYAYDETGNTTTRPGQKLTWDAEGNLAKVADTSGNELASFIYDAGGNRLIRKDTTGTTLYLPGQELKVTPTGAVQPIRYYAHGGETVAYRTGTSTSSLQFLMPNYQGSADVTVNAVSQDTWSLRRFAPFGDERSSPIGIWPSAMDKGFVGGTKDTSTGLTHLGAREYDPTIGRFISADPIFAGGDPLTWNGFGYAGNSPVTNSDPGGTMCHHINGRTECYGGAIGSPYQGKPDKTEVEYYQSSLRHARRIQASGWNGRGTTGPGTYQYIPSTPAAPAPPPCNWACRAKGGLAKAASATGNFVSKHRATIASAVVGVGCGVAIGWTGVGGVACAAAAGAVYGAVSYAQNTPRDQWSAGGFLKAGAAGAAVGAITHGVVGGVAKGAVFAFKGVAPNLAARMSGAAGGLGKGGSVGKGNAAAKTPPVSLTKPKANSGGKAATSSGAKCSFVPGTTVLMADGTHKPIDQLQVGDKVLATDPETGKITPQTVLTTHSNAGTKNLVKITVDTDGKHGTKTGTLTATDNHPFWLPTQKQWKNAGDLKPGMWLRTSAGTHVQITAIKTWTKYQRVHNLTVNTDHTYYAVAGGAPVLVHNCGEKEGFAEVFFDDAEGHVSVAVTHGGRTIHTEAGSRTGEASIATIRTKPHSPGTTVVKIKLPNARNAQLAQKGMEDYNLGMHDDIANNCVTYCARILQAGGLDIDPNMGSPNIVGNLLNSPYPQRKL